MPIWTQPQDLPRFTKDTTLVVYTVQVLHEYKIAVHRQVIRQSVSNAKLVGSLWDNVLGAAAAS